MKQAEFLLNALVVIGFFLLSGLTKMLGVWSTFGMKEIIVAVLLFTLSRYWVHAALAKSPIYNWRDLRPGRKLTFILGGLIVIPGFLTICLVLFSIVT